MGTHKRYASPRTDWQTRPPIKRQQNRFKRYFMDSPQWRAIQVAMPMTAPWPQICCRKWIIKGSIVNDDKAYGSKEVRDYIISQGATYAIPPKSNALEPWDVDQWQYKERHLVECFFNKLKHFRRVATRYDKLASRFQSFVFLACVMILLKQHNKI